MKSFFNDKILINNAIGNKLYKAIKDLPIIDYHCHLNEKEISDNVYFKNITELWLKHDHYKWRAMRICNVDEKYITGNATDEEKFIEYSKIMPQLIGSPLYYWTHLELKMIFGINKPLNEKNALEIYALCNEKLKSLSVQTLLKQFNVELLCTTDDPVSNLNNHGIYNDVKVIPTFRPDRLFNLEEEYIDELSKSSEVNIKDLKSLKEALEKRLDYFISKGCKIADHGMDYLPSFNEDEKIVDSIFKNRKNINEKDKEIFLSHMMYYFARLYKEKNIVMQIHFATFRNINDKLHNQIGKDSGFDVIRHETYSDRLAYFFNELNNQDAMPKIILYSLNSNAIKEIATIAGAFRNVKIGPSWWFNDTLKGNKEQMETIAEYNVLGTFLGMLTDSRSFSSYVRFDFFRRILASLVGEYVEKGEYDYNSALKLMKDICYNNIKEFLNV